VSESESVVTGSVMIVFFSVSVSAFTSDGWSAVSYRK